MKKFLILLPFVILFVLSVFSMLGLGAGGSLGQGFVGCNTPHPYYYDMAGREIVYTANLTAVSESGWIQSGTLPDYPTVGVDVYDVAFWLNGSRWDLFQTAYALFYNPTDYVGGQPPVKFADLDKNKYSVGVMVNMNSSLGLIALIVGLTFLAGIIGFHIFGSGENPVSVAFILLCTGLLAVWGVFSVLAMNLILELELLGPILYFALTVLYTVGIIMKIGGSSGGED